MRGRICPLEGCGRARKLSWRGTVQARLRWCGQTGQGVDIHSNIDTQGRRPRWVLCCDAKERGIRPSSRVGGLRFGEVVPSAEPRQRVVRPQSQVCYCSVVVRVSKGSVSDCKGQTQGKRAKAEWREAPAHQARRELQYCTVRRPSAVL